MRLKASRQTRRLTKINLAFAVDKREFVYVVNGFMIPL